MITSGAEIEAETETTTETEVETETETVTWTAGTAGSVNASGRKKHEKKASRSKS